MQKVQTRLINYEVSEGVQFVRRKKIIDALQENKELGAGQVLELKEELLLIDAQLDRFEQMPVQSTPSLTHENVVSIHSSIVEDNSSIENETAKESFEKSVLQTVKQRIQAYLKACADREMIRQKIDEISILMTPGETQITPSYGGSGGGNGDLRSSKVEQAVLEPFDMLADLRAQYYQRICVITEMEAALNELSEYEQEVIRQKFMVPARQRKKDHTIFTEMGVGKTLFYSLRKTAIINLAYALKII